MIYRQKLGKKETNTKLAITTLLLSVLPMTMIGVYTATTQFAYAQTSHTNNMTEYTDLQGRLSINYPSTWTALPTTNPLQQRVVQFTNMAPFANFNIVIAPEAFAQTDPAIALNAYRLFPSTIPAGYSISQNVECVKYKIVSNRACSIILTSNGKVPSIYIQIASYVNKKMFIFTMQGTHNDFNNYLPMFRNMLTSFKASATSLNTKTAPTVNSTTIQKTPNKLTTPITPKTSMCPPYVECSLSFTSHQFQVQQP
jgi:hypothetical protein